MAEDLRRQQDVFQQAVPQTVKRIPKAKTLEMHGFLCRFDAMARQKKPIETRYWLPFAAPQSYGNANGPEQDLPTAEYFH